MGQQQFLRVVSRDEAERRFRDAVSFLPLEAERVPLGEARGRILAEEVLAPRDVPGFSRANVDGYAVRSADTFGAAEEVPALLRLTGEVLATGVAPRVEVVGGSATPIATGAVLPRGADAAVMVEDTDPEGDGIVAVRRPVVPGANVSHAGSDIARGETILRRGDELGSRETGLLAALGLDTVPVIRRPRVAVFSTGDEIFAPGEELPVGGLHDGNGRILADAVEEEGGIALERGILRDDEPVLREGLERALADCDLVLLSGGTSKGAGDLSYRVVAERGRIVVHGVALKPGKPVVLAVVDETPVVILPGFPTSAVFTFHEFVAPWIRARSGRPPATRRTVSATLPRALVSERGRKEFDLVRLVTGRRGLVAHPVGKGSGSLTTFALADGFVAVPEATERLEKDERVSTQDFHQFL